MRPRVLLIVAAVVAVVLLAGGAGVYAYDRSKADVIGEGIVVGGVDVSGMTPAEAAGAVRRAVLEPLERPIVVRAGGRRFRLTAEQAQLAVDIDGSVRSALARSRDGGMFARTWRNLRGEELDERVPLDISYSEAALDRLVKRVSKKLDRPAVDATVDIESGDFSAQPSRDGRRVAARRLRRALERRIVEPAARRSVKARLVTVKPEVTTDELADRYPTLLYVDRANFQLRLYKNLELTKTYNVAIGAVGFDTPTGLYQIQNKAVNPAWTKPHSDWVPEDERGDIVPGGVPENPLKARWLGIYDGAGIHGTDAVHSIGTAASHGCVRMLIPDVIELYDQVEVGAPIYIA